MDEATSLIPSVQASIGCFSHPLPGPPSLAAVRRATFVCVTCVCVYVCMCAKLCAYVCNSYVHIHAGVGVGVGVYLGGSLH